MKHAIIVALFLISAAMIAGCETKAVKPMKTPRFIEVTVQNHLILHGFDQDNKEILEEVTLEKPMTKLLRVDRIQSVSEKYLLTTYGFGRLVYWEYKGSYAEMKQLLAEETSSEQH